MIAIQIGIIIFLIFILIIIYQDERKRRSLSRKTAKLDRFWEEEKERRRNFRLNTEIDVLYEVIGEKTTPKRNSISRNISLGGINLALNEKLLLGTTLKLQLNLPQATKPIFTEGSIVWTKEIAERFSSQKEERFFATGIKFTQLKVEDEAILKNFINQKVKSLK